MLGIATWATLPAPGGSQIWGQPGLHSKTLSKRERERPTLSCWCASKMCCDSAKAATRSKQGAWIRGSIALRKKHSIPYIWRQDKVRDDEALLKAMLLSIFYYLKVWSSDKCAAITGANPVEILQYVCGREFLYFFQPKIDWLARSHLNLAEGNLWQPTNWKNITHWSNRKLKEVWAQLWSTAKRIFPGQLW
jgi:hypothetical protein